jgi:Reverse transcriptase (RNA-dependent DNA polymerase)/RNase H-like domain found in reverse transcriptase
VFFSSTTVLPEARHGIEQRIFTTGRPVTARYRSLDVAKYKAARDELFQMERDGIVRRSTSCWASPLHMVRKPDGTWRPCGDYRRLNVRTVPDRYTCPNMADLSARLAGTRVFSKLDLRKGYFQVPVHPDDIGKTALITPFGTFEFLRMPGLRNAGQTFQRLMDQIMRGLDYCFVYLDDILIASESLEQHEVHLKEVLSRLEMAGLVLNKAKCVFAAAEVDFLGHRVTAAGISPLQSHVEAVANFPQPTTNKQLMSFLGMLNFYRRFLPRAASVLKPLTDSLLGGKAAAVNWDDQMLTAFAAAKKLLCDATCLVHPEPRAALSLMVLQHIGGVLQQDSPRGPQPLAFFSRKLSAAQSKYSTFDRELLACHDAIRHFRWSLEGRQFCIYTDHKPLTHSLSRASDPWTPRQQRHLSFVIEFTADIRHVSGVQNSVADALSRLPVAAVAPADGGGIDYMEMAAAQAACTETQGLAKSSSLVVVQLLFEGTPLLCDVSTRTPRR